MSVAKVLWVRFLGQIEAALPRKLIPFWKAPAGESFLNTSPFMIKRGVLAIIA